ncbi:hypothetical protein Tco_0116004 [Tanacetum coccineum]
MTEFPQLDSGLVVHIFNPGDDPIACLNKEMAFMLTKNQLRTSSNLRNQETIQDGRVTVQQVQRRQCTQPKRLRNATWFKKKAMLAEAQESGQILDKEQLAFLTDPGITDCHDVQPTIIHNAAFQTDDLDAYNSNYGDISSAKAGIQAMQHFEQTHVDDYPDNEITSDSNIIPYSQYLQETQQAVVQDTNSFVQQDLMILSMIEKMSEQMINHVSNWEKANQEKQSESLTAELERYKERVKTFEQRLNIDLSSREKLIDS